MQCLFCNTDWDAHRVDKKAIAYTCSACVQLLLSLSQAQLKEVYGLATEKGYINKATAIESFMESEDGRKTKNAKRNMVRTRFSRAVRPSRNQIRAQSAAI